MLNKILTLFKVNTLRQLIVIFIVFSIAGSLSLYLSNPILDALNLNSLIEIKLLFIALRLILIFFIYQCLLLLIGTMFGQFRYFWNFEKKILNRFKLLKRFASNVRNNE